MLILIIFFLSVSILLYVLLGGADFGAGMVETFIPNRYRSTISKAIGPVWEANHIWLILVVVILFMGFPRIYSAATLYLHLPVSLLLLGIVLRGSAFVFRHYDAFKETGPQEVYSAIFRFSSFLAPFFLGTTAGAAIYGEIPFQVGSFGETFVQPWLNAFSFSVGGFTCCIFAFLAAVYLIGEVKDPADRKVFVKAARNWNIATVIAGALVFASAYASDFMLLNQFLANPLAMVAVLLATLALPVLWWSLLRQKVVLSRILAGFQVVMIMGAWFFVQYPVVMLFENRRFLTLPTTAAPPATQQQLVIALIIGSLFIFPSLWFLMRTFKKDDD